MQWLTLKSAKNRLISIPNIIKGVYMFKATSKMYRDNGEMFFAWCIEDESGMIGHIEDFPTLLHCEESMMYHLKMWTNGAVCSVNGLLMIVE